MKTCKIGIWNDTVPGIYYDNDGICNYYHLHKNLCETFKRGEEGKADWQEFVKNMKEKKGNSKYHCIVGVSGGVDSSYLMHILVNEYGLNPLAVNLDNGWNSEIAVNNIRKITRKLNIDLETYVVDYEEMKGIMRAYIKSCLPWIDIPTDVAIKSSLYKVSAKEGIKFIIRGNDFRSEGKQPREWTYSDHKQLSFIIKKFSNVKVKTFPTLSFIDIIFNSFVRNIKELKPFYYLDYNKQEAKKLLISQYEWQDYGGHHHENLFTKFAMAYWLPKKFGIDKRIINLSAQVASGMISRDEALNEIAKDFDTPEKLNELRTYFLKKLDFSDEEFEIIMKQPNKFYYDYPNLFSTIEKIYPFFKPFQKLLFKQVPMSFVEIENRKKL